MSVLKKRETIVQNISYMGIMAAVNVVFVLLTYFVPFLLFLLVFILPLCSAIISYYCKKRYFPIYLIVVSAICILIDPSDAIFYVMPSLITGFIFGLFLELKIPVIYTIIVNTLIQFGLSLAFIPLIHAITGRDIVMDMATIFKLNEYEYLEYIKYSFIFLIAFIQMVLTYLVLNAELGKFGIKFNDEDKYLFVFDCVSIGSALLVILFGFVFPKIALIFVFVSFIFALYRVSTLDFRFYKIYLIEIGIIILVTIFFVAALYSKIDKPLGILLVSIFPFLVSCACLINNCLFCKRNKDTINN